jgi:hypothetical protein
MDGLWKLVLIRPFQEVDFLVMEISTAGAESKARVAAAQPLFKTRPTIEGFSTEGDVVRFTMAMEGAKHAFRGKSEKTDVVMGTIVLQGKALPARLERTVNSALGLPIDYKIIRSYYAARDDKDPSSRWDKLQVFLTEVGQTPRGEMVFLDLIAVAPEAKKSADDVRGLCDRLQEIARPYGEAYLADVRSKIVKALVDGKANGDVALDVAQAAEKALATDAPPAARAASARDVATAARSAGKSDVAALAEIRARNAEAQAKAGERPR